MAEINRSIASLLISRGSLIFSAIAVFIMSVIALCGGNSLVCFSVMATDGVVALAWILSASALGFVILRRCRFEAHPCLLAATSGGLGLGLFSLLALGFGLIGWLNRPAAIAFPIASTLIFATDLLLRSPRRQIDRGVITHWLQQPGGSAWLWLVPVISLAMAVVSASVLPGILWKPLDPHPYDVTSYHLLVPREWYEGGRIVPLDHNVFSYFPFNVEMQFLLLMHAMAGPWAAMYACQFLSAGYAGLMVLAVAGSRGERSMFAFNFPGTAAAALASVVPWTLMLAGVAYVESALMLYTALSIAWALHAIRHLDRLLPALILSGILAGFACGVKITAVPMLLLAVPVGVAIALLFHRPPKISQRQIWIGCIALVLAGSIVLSPWLIRNFHWSGNPLFPIAMKSLGQDHFSNVQVQRFITAHSPRANQKSFFRKLIVLWNDVLSYWQYGFVLLPTAFVACVLRWKDRQTWLLIISGFFVLVVWIGFTHLLPRFLVMLIPVSAMAVARMPWGRAWPIGLILVFTAAALGWSDVVPELYRQSNPPPLDGQTRQAIFGLEDMSFMYQISPQLIAARDQHLQVGLVGDAQAFLYDIPMSHMHYRSVFNIAPGDPVDAWIGPQAKGDPNWLLVINPTEIDRLHKTYLNVPPLPPQWAARGPQPFFIHGSDLSK